MSVKAGEEMQSVQRSVRRCKGEEGAKIGKKMQRVRRVQRDAKFCVPLHPTSCPLQLAFTPFISGVLGTQKPFYSFTTLM